MAERKTLDWETIWEQLEPRDLADLETEEDARERIEEVIEAQLRQQNAN